MDKSYIYYNQIIKQFLDKNMDATSFKELEELIQHSKDFQDYFIDYLLEAYSKNQLKASNKDLIDTLLSKHPQLNARLENYKTEQRILTGTPMAATQRRAAILPIWSGQVWRTMAASVAGVLIILGTFYVFNQPIDPVNLADSDQFNTFDKSLSNSNQDVIVQDIVQDSSVLPPPPPPPPPPPTKFNLVEKEIEYEALLAYAEAEKSRVRAQVAYAEAQRSHSLASSYNGQTLSSEDVDRMTTRDISAVQATTAGVNQADIGDALTYNWTSAESIPDSTLTLDLADANNYSVSITDRASCAFQSNLFAKDGKSDAFKNPIPIPKKKTWKRSKKTANLCKLEVGRGDEIPLKGMHVSAQVDGFRARVLIDAYYLNDRDNNLEGTFKLRLPNGATPYFFAFGESVLLDKDQEINSKQLKKHKDLAPEHIIKNNEKNWKKVKEARIVPKEKAALAYTQTVNKQVDPALMEWAGADIFNCRVFPLQAGKVHQVVIGYDINLKTLGRDQIFELDLPQIEGPLVVDLEASHLPSVKPKISPVKSAKISSKKKKTYLHVENPEEPTIQVNYKNTGAIVLQENDDEPYFTANFTPKLETTEANVSAEKAVFALDVSLSSNPDKFNAYLELLEATLNNNREVIKSFAVLHFNIEQYWWQEKFVPNTEANVKAFLSHAQQLVLEGASDLSVALKEASQISWDQQNTINYIFLLSDGHVTWGASNANMISQQLEQGDRIFAFQTGMAGTDISLLNHLTQTTGGAVFSVVSEAQIQRASTAFRNAPWKIESIKINGTEDIILAGNPEFIYNGQPLIAAGRGRLTDKSVVNLTVKQGEKIKHLNIRLTDAIVSDLAQRTYGEIATRQLENLGYLTEKYAIPYATHYRIPGKNCSFLMLESEEDYDAYGINTKVNYQTIQQNKVNSVVEKLAKEAKLRLIDPKVQFKHWVTHLKGKGIDMKLEDDFLKLLDQLPKTAFEVEIPALKAKLHHIKDFNIGFLNHLDEAKLKYETIQEEAQNRIQKGNKIDALRALSSLLEQDSRDLVLSRDIAYSALAYDLPEQAYYLMSNVIQARPYEPQSYRSIANILADMNKVDLAVLYYELALKGNWADRYGEFKKIVRLDYIQFLKTIQKNNTPHNLKNYTQKRLNELTKDDDFENADLVVVITWNTDNTDVDLHIKEPSGEVCYYKNKKTASGGMITQDVTQGYGPEMYVLKEAAKGEYNIQINYFSSNTNRTKTPSKIHATVYKYRGTAKEEIVQKTIELENKKQKLDVLNINFN
ncbi:MAG: VWA domain-containing protein [Saprospiraceae bacterium]|nr:VWA domain-containing protein [Saprospiraceae bacterium]